MLGNIHWGGLRAKIIVWAFVPTTIILGAVALVTFNAYQRVTTDLVIERDREVTRLSASQVATGLAHFHEILELWAQTFFLFENDMVSLGLALSEASSRTNVFDSVLVLDSLGQVVAAVPSQPDILGRDWSERDYFRTVSRTLKPTISNVVRDGLQGAEAIAFAVPIFGLQNEFLGSIVGLFWLDTLPESVFYTTIDRYLAMDSGTTYLVDGNGQVIYRSDIGQGETGDLGQLSTEHVLMNEATSLRTIDSLGQPVVASYARIPGTSWGVISRESWNTVSNAARAYQRFLLFLLALGVLVPALIVTVSVRRMTRPIQDLIGAAREVAGGNFSRRIAASTGDEIENLAEQFNRMAAQLQESYANLEQRVADRTRELSTLNTIAGVVSRSLDLGDILRDALHETLQVMEMELGGIYLLDHKAGALKLAAHRGLSPPLATGLGNLLVNEGFASHGVQEVQPIVAVDAVSDPRLTQAVAADQGIVSLAIVPLSSRGKLLGILFTATRTRREFPDQDVQLLTSIASQIAVAVENARLFETQQRRAEQFRLISEVSRRITSILDIDELLSEIVRLVHEMMGYYMVGIGLVKGDEVIIRTGAGATWDDPTACLPRLKGGREGITGWVVRQGRPLIVPDVSQDGRYARLSAAIETRSELAVPIKTKDAVIGVLDVQSDRLDAFDEIDLAVLESLAAQAAIAIDNARLYEQTRQVAVIEERNRLAHDLHDAVSQTLWTASLIADVLPTLWKEDAGEAHRNLDRLRQLTRGALAEMRTLLLELRPAGLAEARLEALLRQLTDAIAGRKKLVVVFDVAGEAPSLPPDAKIALYRIAQEALNNVAKHAKATQVEVRLHCESGQVRLTVRDNGRGFDPSRVPSECLGLGIMYERAATVGAHLTIDSHIGQGTQVRVAWTCAQGVEQQ